MSSDPNPVSSAPAAAPVERREFLKAAACTVLGGCAMLGPVGAGIVVLLNPLRAKGGAVEVKLTELAALKVGDEPKLYQVVADRRDAWTQFPKQALGAVFLHRKSETEIVAFHASCPHLGCAVEFRSEKDAFFCPCHDSTFAKTGEVVGESPSLRGLDALEVEVRGTEVWVKFLNFKAGTKAKEPIA